MIRKPNNWDNIQAMGESMKLPMGAYVCKIKQARVQDNDYGSQLAVLFDVTEGEHTGFYAKEFAGNTNENKKWKGVLRIWLPRDDGSDKDETTKRVLKGFVTSVERSNPGYSCFNSEYWNETSLAGKAIGVLMRNEEWEWEGKTGWTVRPFKAISVDTVREGSYTLPKDKPLASKASTAAVAHGGYTDVTDTEELPWD